MATQTATYSENTNTVESAPTLRKALRGNALFSLISGLAFTLAASPIADFLGISEASILGLTDGVGFITFIGISLLIFAADLYYLSTRETINLTLAKGVVAMDVGWVVGSVVILLTNALPLTTEGSWAVLIVADIVTAFAIWQAVGIRRA